MRPATRVVAGLSDCNTTGARMELKLPKDRISLTTVRVALDYAAPLLRDTTNLDRRVAVRARHEVVRLSRRIKYLSAAAGKLNDLRAQREALVSWLERREHRRASVNN
jgi:hypothetical protein